jgi:hypothetical protein
LHAVWLCGHPVSERAVSPSLDHFLSQCGAQPSGIRLGARRGSPHGNAEGQSASGISSTKRNVSAVSAVKRCARVVPVWFFIALALAAPTTAQAPSIEYSIGAVEFDPKRSRAPPLSSGQPHVCKHHSMLCKASWANADFRGPPTGPSSRRVRREGRPTEQGRRGLPPGRTFRALPISDGSASNALSAPSCT